MKEERESPVLRIVLAVNSAAPEFDHFVPGSRQRPVLLSLNPLLESCKYSSPDVLWQLQILIGLFITP